VNGSSAPRDREGSTVVRDAVARNDFQNRWLGQRLLRILAYELCVRPDLVGQSCRVWNLSGGKSRFVVPNRSRLKTLSTSANRGTDFGRIVAGKSSFGNHLGAPPQPPAGADNDVAEEGRPSVSLKPNLLPNGPPHCSRIFLAGDAQRPSRPNAWASPFSRPLSQFLPARSHSRRPRPNDPDVTAKVAEICRSRNCRSKKKAPRLDEKRRDRNSRDGTAEEKLFEIRVRHDRIGATPSMRSSVPLAPSSMPLPKSHTRRCRTRNRNQSHWVCNCPRCILARATRTRACDSSNSCNHSPKDESACDPELCEKSAMMAKIRSGQFLETTKTSRTRREVSKWPMRVDRPAKPVLGSPSQLAGALSGAEETEMAVRCTNEFADRWRKSDDERTPNHGGPGTRIGSWIGLLGNTIGSSTHDRRANRLTGRQYRGKVVVGRFLGPLGGGPCRAESRTMKRNSKPTGTSSRSVGITLGGVMLPNEAMQLTSIGGTQLGQHRRRLKRTVPMGPSESPATMAFFSWNPTRSS